MKRLLTAFVLRAGLPMIEGSTARAAEMPPVQTLDLTGALPDGGQIAMVIPDGPKGWYPKGLRHENDGTVDWQKYYGVEFDVEIVGDATVELTATISIPPEPAREALVHFTSAIVSLSGVGAHRVTLPWSAFDFNQAQPAFLKFVKEVSSPPRAPRSP